MKKKDVYRLKAALTITVAVLLMLSGGIGSVLISENYKQQAIQKDSEENLAIAAAVSRNLDTTSTFIYYLLNHYFFIGNVDDAEDTFLESGDNGPLQAYLEECAACAGMFHARIVGFAPDGTQIATGNAEPELVTAATAYRTDSESYAIHYTETESGEMYWNYCFSNGNFRYCYMIPLKEILHSVTNGVISMEGSWIVMTNRSADFLFLICQKNYCITNARDFATAFPALDPAELTKLSECVQRTEIKQYEGNDYLTSCAEVELSDDMFFICVAEDMAGITDSVGSFVAKLAALTFIAMFGIALFAVWAVRLIATQRKTNEALQDEKENTQMHMKFTEAQRFQEMGAMSAVVAHEVNNLMTPIMANSLMLLESVPPEDTDNYDSLLDIYNASERAKELIGKISAVNRHGDQTALAPLKVDDVLSRAYKILDIMPKRQIRVTLNAGCGDALVNGNEMLLQQAIINLCTNAYHAMEETGGELTISSRISDDGKFAQIVVADTGGGIPEKDLDRIFEAFYTTKPAGKGTGLGLAIVRETARELGGTVTVVNRNGGAEFTLSLPIF